MGRRGAALEQLVTRDAQEMSLMKSGEKVLKIQLYELLLSSFLSTVPSSQGERVLVNNNANHILGVQKRSSDEREGPTNWAQTFIIISFQKERQ